jgi:MoxR-like ATPase
VPDGSAVASPAEEFADLKRSGDAIAAAIGTVVSGKPDVVRTALTVLLAEGHLLIEDVPGVGKTVLAKAMAASVDCSVSRIQFTPDLMPGDITGVSMYNRAVREFEFKPGAIFANIVVGDEINRASPKTQSALLECMEERQVTVDGATYPLASPFIVIATQNPIGMEGTYALPEAQRDRFMARVTMGYPGLGAERAMLTSRDTANPLAALAPVIDRDALMTMIRVASSAYTSPVVSQYALDIVRATREDDELRLGASPRATLQLVRAAKARAALDGREFVLPDDIDALAVPVLAHRLLPASRALGRHHESIDLMVDVVRRIVSATPVPGGPRE